MYQTPFSKKTLASNQNKEEKLWESKSHSTEVEISNLDLTILSSTEEIQISMKMRDASRVSKENMVYIRVDLSVQKIFLGVHIQQGNC